MTNRRAFALRDALIGTVVLAGLAVTTLPALSQVRMDSMRQACIGNYRFIASTTSSYINDNAGKMWALSWKAGMLDPGFSGVRYFQTDSEAQSNQAALIVRRLTGLNPVQTPVPQGWLPQILNAHTALLDYVNLPIPASFLACPSDWTRQNYLVGELAPWPAHSGDGSAMTWHQAYSTSYQWDVYQWSPSRQYQYANSTRRAPMMSLEPSNSNLWQIDGDSTVPDALGPRLATDVRFPSQKVFLSDNYTRHSGETRFYADQAAGQDLLFHDGSVRYYRTDSTNPGWNAGSRTKRGNMTLRMAFTKQADVFGSLAGGARSTNYAAGWYRWTRGGLYGWDLPRLSSMVGKPPSPAVIENEVDTGPATGNW